MSNANEHRILITGYLPKPPAGEVYDVVDSLGEACALPDNTWHMGDYRYRGLVEQLPDMPQYVASVHPRDVDERILGTATAVVLFDKVRNFTIGLRRQRAQRLLEIAEQARHLGVPSVFLRDYVEAKVLADTLRLERQNS